MKRVLQNDDIRFDESTESVFIGLSRYDINYVFGIVCEKESPQIIKITVRFKNGMYDHFILNDVAVNKLMFIKGEWDERKKKEREDARIKQLNGETFKKKLYFLRIGLNYWILYLILIFGFCSKSFGAEGPLAGDRVEEFPYSYIYDVNLDKCVTVDAYSTKFSYDELKNPMFVGEFQQRPGELVFINKQDEMYVFTDTNIRCQNYRKYFLEEMEKQIKDEESKYTGDSILD